MERTFKPLQQFTRGWMMAESTHQYGVEQLGLRTWRHFWIVGRAGVLGSCPPEVAAGADRVPLPRPRGRGVDEPAARPHPPRRRHPLPGPHHGLGRDGADRVRPGGPRADRRARPAHHRRRPREPRLAVRRLAGDAAARGCRRPRRAHHPRPAGDAGRRPHHRRRGVRPEPARRRPRLDQRPAQDGSRLRRADGVHGAVPRSRGGPARPAGGGRRSRRGSWRRTTPRSTAASWQSSASWWRPPATPSTCSWRGNAHDPRHGARGARGPRVGGGRGPDAGTRRSGRRRRRGRAELHRHLPPQRPVPHAVAVHPGRGGRRRGRRGGRGRRRVLARRSRGVDRRAGELRGEVGRAGRQGPAPARRRVHRARCRHPAAGHDGPLPRLLDLPPRHRATAASSTPEPAASGCSSSRSPSTAARRSSPPSGRRRRRSWPKGPAPTT